MKKYALYLVITALVTSLLGSLCEWAQYEGLGVFENQIQATNFYMKFDSISKFSIVLAFYISLHERSLLKLIVALGTVFALGEVADEFFFDPTRMQWNEILQIIGGLIYVIIWKKNTT